MKTGIYCVMAIIVLSACSLIAWDKSPLGLYIRGSAIHGLLYQYALAAHQYSDRWGTLPPIQDWRSIPDGTEYRHLSDGIADPRVMVVQSKIWGAKLRSFENFGDTLPRPLLVINDGIPFPVDTLYVVMDGCDLVCVRLNGERQAFEGSDVYVGFATASVSRLGSVCDEHIASTLQP